MYHEIGAETDILQVAPLDEVLINIIIPIAQLNAVPRRKRISCPGLFPPASSSNPASNQISVVGVTGAVSLIPVNRSWSKKRWDVEIGRHSFETQVDIVQLRELGNINARIYLRAGGTNR